MHSKYIYSQPNKQLHEIIFAGIERSGNHPIFNWIMDQFSGPKYHSWCHTEDIMGNSQLFRNIKKTVETDNFEVALINFENEITSDLAIINTPMFKNSSKVTKILLLRDPFNWFASAQNSYETICTERHKNLSLSLWKMYAREFLGITNFFGTKICVKYNEWFKNIEYRKTLSKTIGNRFSDKLLDRICGDGGGSSFDRHDYQGRAREMKVLSRWKQCLDKRDYVSKLRDNEILEMSYRIFGADEAYHFFSQTT